jgi:tetratricopeptide (TPR) repeat protein
MMGELSGFTIDRRTFAIPLSRLVYAYLSFFLPSSKSLKKPAPILVLRVQMAGIEDTLQEAEMLLASGETKKAMSAYEKVIKAAPGDPRGYFGKAESSLGEPKVSIDHILEWYKKAIELDPKNVFYLTSYGNFCLDVGKFVDAEASYNKATELDEENAPLYFSEFAIGYYMKAPIVYEKFLDDKTMAMIHKKSIEYVLKAINLTPEKAKALMADMK